MVLDAVFNKYTSPEFSQLSMQYGNSSLCKEIRVFIRECFWLLGLDSQLLQKVLIDHSPVKNIRRLGFSNLFSFWRLAYSSSSMAMFTIILGAAVLYWKWGTSWPTILRQCYCVVGCGPHLLCAFYTYTINVWQCILLFCFLWLILLHIVHHVKKITLLGFFVPHRESKWGCELPPAIKCLQYDITERIWRWFFHKIL